MNNVLNDVSQQTAVCRARNAKTLNLQRDPVLYTYSYHARLLCALSVTAWERYDNAVP